MRKYEIMYIIRPDLEEEKRKQLIESMSKVITDNDSEIVDVNEWGMRELAYEIDKYKSGYYVVMNVKATETARSEFERLIGMNEDVIRHIVIRHER